MIIHQENEPKLITDKDVSSLAEVGVKEQVNTVTVSEVP